MSDELNATNSIIYTYNEGIKWHECLFSNETLRVTRIISDPQLSLVRFLLYGTRGNNNNKGVIITLDFDPLHPRNCKGWENPGDPFSDYEIWEPSDAKGDRCLLGRRTQFVRRKKEAECDNPPEFVSRPHIIKNCSCTEENYECDHCYKRSAAGTCEIDRQTCPNYDPQKQPEICITSWFQTQGYRKVPGDSCDTKTGVDHEPLVRKCITNQTIYVEVTKDSGPDALLISLPILLVVIIIVISLYIFSAKNLGVRDCLLKIVPESVLPKYSPAPIIYTKVNMDFNDDDLQEDAQEFDDSDLDEKLEHSDEKKSQDSV